MAKIIELEDMRTDEQKLQDEAFKFNCVKSILNIIIESSRLGIIGRLIDTNNEVIYKKTIHELYESILNNILTLEKTDCELHYEREEFDYIIYNLGNLDYERDGEIGVTISNYFSNLLLYHYI